MSTLESDKKHHRDAFAALVAGRHHDPFSIFGLHKAGDERVVRTFQPHADSVELIDANGDLLADMERVHADGLFAAIMPPRLRYYRLRLTRGQHSWEIEDPYRFPQTLGDIDLYLLGEGSDKQIYQKLGSRVRTVAGVTGTRFAVWAPNASRVSVVGDFNDWDGRRHAMRLHPGNGLWEIFIPGVGSGDKYKFELLDQKLLLDGFAGRADQHFIGCHV